MGSASDRRVVVTGMGIVSCLGNDLDTVSANLRAGRSGIRAQARYAELGMRSQVAGWPDLDLDARLDRKQRRFLGDASAWSVVALQDAVAQAGLPQELVSNVRTGVIAGSGGGSPVNQVEAADTLRQRGIRRVGPYFVPRTMSSTVSAAIATNFQVKGVNFSISSACATSAHCIGIAADQIRSGRQDIVFAGGGEEESWEMSMMFDAMGALSSKRNAEPAKASRAYDADRDGFVIAGGAGMLVLEEREHALQRGATILAELTGFGMTSDGADMVAPSGEGAVRCMRMALEGVAGPVDYVNAHGTSTPVGDVMELGALREVFGTSCPPISSTKSLSGHSLGAAGVQEAIYCLLMMRDGFIAGSVNVDTPDPAAADMPIVTQSRGARLGTVLSNSFGFGGTNASLVFSRGD